jgi:phage/plasmid-associated DNA primase
VQPWLDHVRNVLTSGDAVLYEYVISWLAHILQYPSNKIGTGLLFKSEQGAGKGIFFDLIIKHIIGRDYSTSINDMNQLLGNFNAIVEHKLLTVCDEIQNYGGAYKSNDKLKSLITNESIIIERKGFDSQTVEDFNNYVFLTNNDWAVKVETSDRRYVIIEASSERIGDRGYFNNLLRLTNDVVGAHLYNWLMRFEITIDLRSVPNTKARTQLKMNSVPEPILWLIQVLRGEIENIVCGEVLYHGSALFRSFAEWAARGGYNHNYTERMFLQSINKIVKSGVRRQDGKTVRGYILNKEELLAALKVYLKLPDLDLDEI